MNKLKLRIANWLLHSAGYQWAAVKQKDGEVWIDGDTVLIRHIDTDRYLWGKAPKRCQCK